jgi:hypothetical protein
MVPVENCGGALHPLMDQLFLEAELGWPPKPPGMGFRIRICVAHLLQSYISAPPGAARDGDLEFEAVQ